MWMLMLGIVLCAAATDRVPVAYHSRIDGCLLPGEFPV
jgi:hypothetical protein